MKFRFIILVGLFAALGLWLFRQRMRVEQSNASANAVKLTEMPVSPPRIAQVEAPRLDAVKPSENANAAANPLTPIPGAPPKAREEITAAINDIINRLNAGDSSGVLENYLVDLYADAKARQQIGPFGYPSAAEWRQLLEKYQSQYVEMLRAIETATPEYERTTNTAHFDHYSYKIVDPITGQDEYINISKSDDFKDTDWPKSGWNFDFDVLRTWDNEVKQTAKQ